MSATHNITLDVTKQRLRLDQTAHVRVGDKSSQIVSCSLTKAGAAYTPTSGTTAYLEILKPDGMWTKTSASISGTKVTGTIPLAALSTPGECKRAYFRLVSGSVEDTTEDFLLVIYASATQGSSESAPYSDQIAALIGDIQASYAEIEGDFEELYDMVLSGYFKFADPIEWSKAREYDVLTGVVYNGDTYVSKQAVPANQVEITNTDYWVRAASNNAQVEEYRQDVADLSDHVDTFDGRITANSDAIADLNGELEQFEDDTRGTLAEHGQSIEKEQRANSIPDIISPELIGVCEVPMAGFIPNFGYASQSAQDFVYKDDNNVFFMFPNSESTYCMVKRADIIGNEQENYVESNALHHADTMTYDENTGFYLGRSGSAESGTVEAYNSRFEFVKDITNFSANPMYDKKRKKVYLIRPWDYSNEIYECNEDLSAANLIGRIEIPISAKENMSVQGAACYDGMVYITMSTDFSSKFRSGINVLDIDSLSFVKTVQISQTPVFCLGEIEGCDFDKDGNLFFSSSISVASRRTAYLNSALWKAQNGSAKENSAFSIYARLHSDKTKFKLFDGSNLNFRNIDQMNACINGNKTWFYDNVNAVNFPDRAIEEPGFLTFDNCVATINAYNLTVVGGIYARNSIIHAVTNGTVRLKEPETASPVNAFVIAEGSVLQLPHIRNEENYGTTFTHLYDIRGASSMAAKSSFIGTGIEMSKQVPEGLFYKTEYTTETNA